MHLQYSKHMVRGQVSFHSPLGLFYALITHYLSMLHNGVHVMFIIYDLGFVPIEMPI